MGVVREPATRGQPSRGAQRLGGVGLPGHPQHHTVLTLQRLVGNHATIALLGGAGSMAVQRFAVPTADELKEAGARVEAFSGNPASARNANLWRLHHKESSSSLYLLGTVHMKVNDLPDLSQAAELLAFLQRTPFNKVFAELVHETVDVNEWLPKVNELLTHKADLPVNPTRARLGQHGQKMSLMKSAMGNDSPILDDFFSFLAAKGKEVGSLETDRVRADIRQMYVAQGGVNAEVHEAHGEADLVLAGNQAAVSGNRSKELKEGIDSSDIEARNRYWLRESQKVHELPYKEATVLWVVGAGHIGGLASSLTESGWTAEPVNL
jgi:hypothetical protein